MKYGIWALFLLMNHCSSALAQGNMPAELKRYINNISSLGLDTTAMDIVYSKVEKNIYKVQVSLHLKEGVQTGSWQLSVRPAFQPRFHWAPHLTPDSNHVIAQHVFRAPALIVTDASQMLTIIPDLDLMQKGSPVPWYMDMNAAQNLLVVGMGNTKVKEHVLFEKAPGAFFPAGAVQLAFYCIFSDSPKDLRNPWQRTVDFMWRRWGAPLYRQGEPLHHNDMEPYIRQTYQWAFTSWRKPVWQEFEWNGKQVGAPVFIVNVTQSPGYPGAENQREFTSIWNQAWFNSLRSAQGLYRFARRTHRNELKELALKTKELALSFPQRNGIFPSVIATEMEEVTGADGKKYQRSKGWGTKYFGNSNRNPYTWDARAAPYHIADMSFTAYWMLVWYDELEKDKRLLEYARRYADALIRLQDASGFFPAWLKLEDLKPMDHLNQSPETSISVTFLLKLYELTKDRRYRASATKAMQAVMEKIIPTGQWEDFETYWSCSRVGSNDWVGKKIARNNMFKQNNFSIFWTAQALLECYRLTQNKEYLQWGQRTLDELLMFQAVWQPPYMAVRTLGGFGVMNADAEWNDSRQSLFAELIFQYGKLLHRPDYCQRAIAALKASFVMMYTPLNPASMQQWQARWPFFNDRDYGFMMENYGHDGATDAQGLGIGEFTIYDWGNGAAAEAYNRICDHYGADLFRKPF
ncbi:glycoside hydrolase family 88 protein [Niabella drilacis]|uniref:Uncharacterized protein n=1 Tax=Niabella drilacis (strain DSM 25811 / CCM 8410 / CCUG 62505 / LMG 26954 / E90) TaxID=1285928 RepID=A0A1G6JMF9_NIADE|nr:hypothetical protein [Niabella drilacis]SDC19851.1 hypothetical protein SAMN04487894_101579 [Niabella drilacis]